MKTSSTSLCTRIFAAALLLACSQWASAHAHPKQQTPGAGQSVGTDTKQVSIEFDDALEPAFSSIKVTDATGADSTNGKSGVDPNDKKHMTVALGTLKPGVYTVAWVAVAADGHRTQGHYAFVVK
ncbi:copper resistance protein [Trinickia dabaoshanensis]|uniref:Copper resistance protein n=1 Tax=Trinickia dabaoshanensis TaxID=564714 RepID=A0A2N7VDF3_9BURK|nr:copper resistance protein CopC [Trinickia dabaoshanensis]PMS15190.1 copper resistance protein [Trinickia dabaoshanensis]